MADYDLYFDGHYFCGARQRPKISPWANCSGIYCVYTCTYHGQLSVPSRLLYIGQAVKLRERITRHEKRHLWLRALQPGETLCYSIASFPLFGRVHIEAAMLFEHQPPFNEHRTNWFGFQDATVRTHGKNAWLSPVFSLTLCGFRAAQERRSLGYARDNFKVPT